MGEHFCGSQCFLQEKLTLNLFWENLPQIENNKIFLSTQLVRKVPMCVYR